MALTGNAVLRGGVELPQAYYRIDGVTGGKRGYSARMQVFASHEHAQGGEGPLQEFDFTFPYVAGRDPVALAYLVAPTVEGMPADLQPVLEDGQIAGTLPDELQPKAEADADA